MRVVPNLYPAFERQEVVIHTPEHIRSFADLSDAQVALVAEAWQHRIETALDEGFGYVHALVNEGRLAGASLPHSHSQLVWLPRGAARRRPAARAASLRSARLGRAARASGSSSSATASSSWARRPLPVRDA